jgi:hypothetical protein
VEGSCEHGNEPLGSVRGRKCLDQLGDLASWSWLHGVSELVGLGRVDGVGQLIGSGWIGWVDWITIVKFKVHGAYVC